MTSRAKQNGRPKPREPVPASEQSALQDAGAQVWNDEADRVEIYRDGDTLKYRTVHFDQSERADFAG